MQHSTLPRPYPMTPAPQPTSVLLGRYRVLETNDDGGFGMVSVCWDARLQRRVAIKRMPLRLDPDSPIQTSTIDEALAEARTVSMLAHPNIVTVYDFESDGQYSYLVMEYVDGLNLAELLARVEGGVLTFDECAHLVDSLASALSYAHENGVLHLDIKPANIMIDRSGVVKLGDFGMASLASAAGYGGARGGTVGYMPPEQIVGDYVDERTDVFSLAVVLWEALTGVCPYAASTPEQSLQLIERGPSPTLSRIEPDLAGIVEETLLHALDPSPAVRLASVDVLARDLVRPLGDSQAGALSLSDLLRQTEEDVEPNPVGDWNRLRVPLLVRLPWLGGACTRLLAAATASWAAFQAIPLLFPESSNALAFGAGGVAVASAAWPPLGGALGIIALLAAIGSTPSRMAVPLILILGALGLVWWVAAGRRKHLAGSALLLPCCLSSPLAGVGLAGFALDPVSALLTGGASWFMWLLFDAAARMGFGADALAGALRDALVTPRAWILLAGCSIASFLCALLSNRERMLWGVLGQIVAVVTLVFAYVACAHVENANIAAALDGPALVIALSLGATLCIATILTGGHVHNLEGDDTV